jgi:hypothetical protein
MNKKRQKEEKREREREIGRDRNTITETGILIVSCLSYV